MRECVMKPLFKPSQSLLALVFLLLAHSAWAGGVLLPEKSSVRFVSVKNAVVAEVHHFSGITGWVDDEGRVVVNIPLVSVETMIPVRNERMRELFFETGSFPAAVIQADVDLKAVAALANGEYATMKVLFELNLHGQQQMLEANVLVARLGKELHVSTQQPLIINTASFALTDGVERLREVAGLNNIATAVPVTASLVFEF
jgi:hypothetical protein